MIMDLTELLSNAQPITASTASTNSIDLGLSGTPYGSTTAIAREIGVADVPLTVNVVQAFNNLTGLQISIQVADDAAFTTNLNTVYLSPVYTLAQVQVGAKYLLPDSFPVGTNQRYVRLFYTVTGTAPTTGQITAGVVLARQKNSRY